MLEGVEDCGAVFVGEVEFAGGVWGEVVGYYAVDFGAKGLDCDWIMSVGLGISKGGNEQDCHFSPI